MKASFALIVILGILGWLFGFEVLVSTFAENPLGWMPALGIATIILHVLFFASSEKSNPPAKPVSLKKKLENYSDISSKTTAKKRIAIFTEKRNDNRSLTKSERKQFVSDLYTVYPEMSISEVAQKVGVNPQTVRDYYKEMGINTEKEMLLARYFKKD